MWLLCQILALLCLQHHTFAAFMTHKYTVDVESGFLCPDNNELEIPMKQYRVDRLNRTHRAFTMAFSFAQPIDKTVEGIIITERASGGGWTNLPIFPHQQDPCRKIMDSPIQSSKDLFVHFGRAIGLKNSENCDIPAGNYTLDRYPIDISSDLPFWGGRFRFTVVLRRIKTNKKIWCTMNLVNFKEVH